MKKLNIPNLFLRIEGITVLILSTILYFYLDGKWPMFVILFLAPDLVMLGYLVNKRIGSISYNVFHFYLLPAILILLGIFYNYNLLILLALIWLAHIGIDRVLGYGLKYETGFKDTHMQKV